MNAIIYDKTFEGFLTAVFDCYDKKITPLSFAGAEGLQTSIFSTVHETVTDISKTDRVWKGLHQKLSASGCKMLAVDFLSELPDVELLLFRYIQKSDRSQLDGMAQ